MLYATYYLRYLLQCLFYEVLFMLESKCIIMINDNLSNLVKKICVLYELQKKIHNLLPST